MHSAFRLILQRAELAGCDVFARPEIEDWPPGALDQLVSTGILAAIDRAAGIEYDGCDERCFITNDGFMPHPDDGQRLVCLHRCRNGCGHVVLDAGVFDRWRFSLCGLAGAVRRTIDSGGQMIEDVPGRLVEVGRVVSGEIWRDLFLARGLAWDDATTAFADARRLKASPAPLVLAMATLPAQPVWPDCTPALTVLSDVATFEEAGLELDLEGVIDRPTRPHADAAVNKWITVTEAAQLLISDVSGITLVQAKARVSKAANASKFTTNGKQRQARRIDRESFSVWRLQQREKDLAAWE